MIYLSDCESNTLYIITTDMQMREIKFRCRDKEAEWMFEFNLLDEEWYNEKLGTIPLDESQVIMQYTWLKDKNWKEIYEGDILMIWKELIEVVKWVGDGEWMWDKQPLVWFVHHQSIYKEPVEIIWNIYENVDMLE